MSFLEKIFGKKEEEQVFRIEDAEGLLSRNFDEKFQTFKEDSSKIYQEMQSVAANMQKSLKDFLKAEFNGPVDYQLLQNVIAHRKSFIQKMEIMIEQIKEPMQPSLDSILEFSKSSSLAILEANEKTVKDYYFLKELFERESESSIENFKILGKISNNFENLISNRKENLLSVRNAQDELQSIKEEAATLNQAEEYIKTLNSKLSDLALEQNNFRDGLDKFKKGEDWLHYNELLEKRGKLEEEVFGIKSEMLQEISQIEKPLKKFKNLVDKGIVKIENEKNLKKYAESTFDSLIEEKNSENINSILKIVQNSIYEGRIELKDREKTLAELKWVVENNVFGNSLEKYILLKEDSEKLKKDIDEQKAFSIKNELENKIEDIERQIEMARLEMDNAKKQTEKMKNSINERKITLEKTLNFLTERKVSLII